MKLEFTMNNETEEGLVEIKACQENQHPDTPRNGTAFLNNDCSEEVVCNCRTIYSVFWFAKYPQYSVPEKRSIISILPAGNINSILGKDLGHVLFQNYKPLIDRK